MFNKQRIEKAERIKITKTHFTNSRILAEGGSLHTETNNKEGRNGSQINKPSSVCSFSVNSLSRARSIMLAKLWSSLADLEELESAVALISPGTNSDLVTVKREMEREGKVAKQRRRWKKRKRTRIAEDDNLIAEIATKRQRWPARWRWRWRWRWPPSPGGLKRGEGKGGEKR